MSVAYLDTPVAVWLHDGLTEELSIEAKRQIEANDLLISPMVYLELEYLFQRKRVGARPAEIATALNASFGVDICRLPFAAVVVASVGIDWTEDPFDRLIVGQAQANHGGRLITPDRVIRKHYANAVW